MLRVAAEEDEESEPHALSSTDYQVCQRGDVNFFLLRFEQHIGNVSKIRLWHNNRGKNPSW